MGYFSKTLVHLWDRIPGTLSIGPIATSSTPMAVPGVFSLLKAKPMTRVSLQLAEPGKPGAAAFKGGWKGPCRERAQGTWLPEW